MLLELYLSRWYQVSLAGCDVDHYGPAHHLQVTHLRQKQLRQDMMRATSLAVVMPSSNVDPVHLPTSTMGSHGNGIITGAGACWSRLTQAPPQWWEGGPHRIQCWLLGWEGGARTWRGRRLVFRELPNPCRPEYIGKVFKSRCMFGQFDRKII